MRLKILDMAAIALSLTIAAAGFFRMASAYTSRDSVLKIESADAVFLYSMAIDAEIHPGGPVEICRIRIEEGAAWVEDSTCPQNICIRMGKIRNPGEWIACLPHGLMISIEGTVFSSDSEYAYDVLSY